MKRSIIYRYAVAIAFAIFLTGTTLLAQSPSTLRVRCPNTSVYSIVQITGVGDIKIQPCANKTTTFTQNVVIPNITSVGLANGTAALPSLFFTNSPTTGVYRSAANVFGIATAGVANTTFGAVANTHRSASHVFSNVAGTAEFASTLTPSDTVGTLAVGDCVTTATACLSIAQSGDTITFGSGTATTNVLTGVKSQQLQRTITAAATTGNQTISKQAGTVNLAAAAASIVVTNTTVTTSSIVTGVIRTADTTCTFIKSIVPTANTITITMNAACNAETSVGFVVWN